MRPLDFKVVVAALSLLGIVMFSICILWDLAVPSYSMMAIWKVLFPGFQTITWGSHILGLAEIILYAVYTALIFVLNYNY